MSIRSYVDPEFILDRPTVWLKSEKFSRNKKTHTYLVLEYIKKYQASSHCKDQHVVQILDFEPLKEGEQSKRIVHLKKIGRNIIGGNTETDLFEKLTKKAHHKERFELTKDQKNNWKASVKNYLYGETNRNSKDFFETTIKDRFFLQHLH